MKILAVFFCLENYHICHKSLATISGEDESCAPEGCYLSGLGPLNPVSSE